MKISNAVIWLSVIILVLALTTTIFSIFGQEAGEAFSFRSVQGEKVVLSGKGLYKFDTVFIASGFKSQDLVTLFIAIPFLLISTLYYRRGSLKAGLLLLGILAYFIYAYASLSLGAFYNELFLLYIAIFSCSLFSSILLWRNIHLSTEIINSLPKNAPAVYIILSGILTLIVWLAPLIAATVENIVPAFLGHYTTLITYVLDLGIITPLTFISGYLILKNDPEGYKLLFPLIGIIIFLIPVISLATYFQVRAGTSFSAGEIIGPISGFLLLGLFGVWVLRSILSKIKY